jgi:sulfur carrier protein
MNFLSFARRILTNFFELFYLTKVEVLLKSEKISRSGTAGNGAFMEITVNGEKRRYEEGLTLRELMEDLKISEKVMAAAVNMEIVKEDRWGEHTLRDGDRVELLHFVGGG